MTSDRRVVLALAAGLLLHGCDAEEGRAMAGAETLRRVPKAADDDKGAEEPPGGVPTEHGAAVLDNAFMPDPHVLEGTAGGPGDASSFGEGCAGHVSEIPDHVLVAKGTFAALRVLGRAEAPVTFVIQTEEGGTLCTEAASLEPALEAPFGPGVHRIWVGAASADATVPYLLGFSELESVTPAMLTEGVE